VSAHSSAVLCRAEALSTVPRRGVIQKLYNNLFGTIFHCRSVQIYCSLLRLMVSERSILWLTRKEVSHATAEMGC